jgi:2-polyprenyl-3-methyl-5-hydroxy-6-metoxy-1,4-benzoquinol methylase
MDNAKESAQRVCPWWLGYFLASPVRKLSQDPRTILAPYVKQGMTVLDFGSAMGFFSIPLAQMVGPTGKVICVDMQEKMLARLTKRAQKAGVSAQIETRLCAQNSFGLEPLAGRIDFVLLFAVAHEVPAREALFAALASVLKAGATLLIAEPKGHVSAENFARTLAIAKDRGFAEVGTPQITQSRAVLLQRAPGN